MRSVLKRLFFIPDCHVPFHDERAFALALKARQYFRPHHTFILGDFGDFYSVSVHSKDPRRVRQLEDEVAAMRKALAQIEDLGDKRHFIAGNHEARLERYLADNGPALFNLLSIPSLLDLERLGWSYTPYRQHYRIGKLCVTHDTGDSGRYADQKARDVFASNVALGHTHRLGLSYQGDARGDAHVGMMCGWLGDVERIDYAHKVRAMQWQLGFGVGFMDRTGTVRLHAIPILNYTAEVRGKLIRG